MLGPVVVTMTAIQFGLPGWLFLGALFVAAGLVSVPTAAWAERRREPVVV
jgi:hypothetical protein